MCINIKEPFLPLPPSPVFRPRSRKPKVQVPRLTRKKKRDEHSVEINMVLQNLKLYLTNRSIQEENEKLRQKALLLHQENVALMSEFQKKLSHLG